MSPNVPALIKHEQIVTTLTEGKELRPIVEKLSPSQEGRPLDAPSGDLGNARPRPGPASCSTCWRPLQGRQGGYTRIIKAASATATTADGVIEFATATSMPRASIPPGAGKASEAA